MCSSCPAVCCKSRGVAAWNVCGPSAAENFCVFEAATACLSKGRHCSVVPKHGLQDRLLQPEQTAGSTSTLPGVFSGSIHRESEIVDSQTTYATTACLLQGILLDQFGVLHDGQKAYPAAIPAVKWLHEQGLKILILSNSSKSEQTTTTPKLSCRSSCNCSEVVHVCFCEYAISYFRVTQCSAANTAAWI